MKVLCGLSFLVGVSMTLLMSVNFAYGAATRTTPAFVYILRNDGIIHQYRVNAKNALEPLLPERANVRPLPPLPDAPAWDRYTAVIDSNQQYLYVAATYSKNPTISQYRLDAQGQLHPLTTSPLPLPDYTSELTMDPKGRFLYAAGQAGAMYIYRIGHDGILKPPLLTKIAHTFSMCLDYDGNRIPRAMDDSTFSIDSKGHYLWVCHDFGTVEHRKTDVKLYQIRSDGCLRITPIHYFENADHRINSVHQFIGEIYFVPKHPFVYIQSDQNRLLCFRLTPRHLTRIPGIINRTDGWINEIDATGKYAFSYNNGVIFVYCIGANGKFLQTIHGMSDPHLNESGVVAHDSTGQFFAIYDPGIIAAKAMVHLYRVQERGSLCASPPMLMPGRGSSSILVIARPSVSHK